MQEEKVVDNGAGAKVGDIEGESLIIQDIINHFKNFDFQPKWVEKIVKWFKQESDLIRFKFFKCHSGGCFENQLYRKEDKIRDVGASGQGNCNRDQNRESGTNKFSVGMRCGVCDKDRSH